MKTVFVDLDFARFLCRSRFYALIICTKHVSVWLALLLRNKDQYKLGAQMAFPRQRVTALIKIKFVAHSSPLIVVLFVA